MCVLHCTAVQHSTAQHSTLQHITAHYSYLHARAAADIRRWQAAAAARQAAAAASARASGPGCPGEDTWRWKGVCRTVGRRKRGLTGVECAWKMPPYNVELSRRHEPVQHNTIQRVRSLGGSRERGVVVREILWRGRGVTKYWRPASTAASQKRAVQVPVQTADGQTASREGEPTQAGRRAGGQANRRGRRVAAAGSRNGVVGQAGRQTGRQAVGGGGGAE